MWHGVEGTGQLLCNLYLKRKVKGKILGICNGVPLSAALFCLYMIITLILERKLYNFSPTCEK